MAWTGYTISLGSYNNGTIRLKVSRDFRPDPDRRKADRHYELADEQHICIQDALRRVLAIMDAEQPAAVPLLPERELAGVLRSLDLA